MALTKENFMDLLSLNYNQAKALSFEPWAQQANYFNFSKNVEFLLNNGFKKESFRNLTFNSLSALTTPNEKFSQNLNFLISTYNLNADDLFRLILVNSRNFLNNSTEDIENRIIDASAKFGFTTEVIKSLLTNSYTFSNDKAVKELEFRYNQLIIFEQYLNAGNNAEFWRNSPKSISTKIKMGLLVGIDPKTVVEQFSALSVEEFYALASEYKAGKITSFDNISKEQLATFVKLYPYNILTSYSLQYEFYKAFPNFTKNEQIQNEKKFFAITTEELEAREKLFLTRLLTDFGFKDYEQESYIKWFKDVLSVQNQTTIINNIATLIGEYDFKENDIKSLLRNNPQIFTVENGRITSLYAFLFTNFKITKAEFKKTLSLNNRIAFATNDQLERFITGLKNFCHFEDKDCKALLLNFYRFGTTSAEHLLIRMALLNKVGINKNHPDYLDYLNEGFTLTSLKIRLAKLSGMDVKTYLDEHRHEPAQKVYALYMQSIDLKKSSRPQTISDIMKKYPYTEQAKEYIQNEFNKRFNDLSAFIEKLNNYRTRLNESSSLQYQILSDVKEAKPSSSNALNVLKMLEERFNLTKNELLHILKSAPNLVFMNPDTLLEKINEIHALYNYENGYKDYFLSFPAHVFVSTEKLQASRSNLIFLGVDPDVALKLQDQMLTNPTKSAVIYALQNDDENEQ